VSRNTVAVTPRITGQSLRHLECKRSARVDSTLLFSVNLLHPLFQAFNVVKFGFMDQYSCYVDHSSGFNWFFLGFGPFEVTLPE
jgi:hypothetical protein